MSIKRFFSYEGKVLPLSGNLGCLVVIAVILNVIVGVRIIVQNLVPGIPLGDNVREGMWVTGIGCDPLILLWWVYSGILSIFSGKDVVTEVEQSYSTGTHIVTPYRKRDIGGDQAKLRGLQRLLSGLFLLGIKWVPFLIGRYFVSNDAAARIFTNSEQTGCRQRRERIAVNNRTPLARGD